MENMWIGNDIRTANSTPTELNWTERECLKTESTMFCSHNHYCHHRHHLSLALPCACQTLNRAEWSISGFRSETLKKRKICCSPKFARFVARFLFFARLCWHIHFTNLLYRPENVYIMLTLICIHLCTRLAQFFLFMTGNGEFWLPRYIHAFDMQQQYLPRFLQRFFSSCQHFFCSLRIRFRLFIFQASISILY